MAETKKKSSSTRSKSSNSKSNTRAKEKAKELQAKRKANQRVLDEIWAIIVIALGVFFAVAVFTNGAGEVGVGIQKFLLGCFGPVAKILPFIMIIFGILLFAKKTPHFNWMMIIFLFIGLLMLCTIFSIKFYSEAQFAFNKIGEYYSIGAKGMQGGMFGMIISGLLIKWIGEPGCWLFSIVVLLSMIMLVINTPISKFFTFIGDKIEARRLEKQNLHLNDNPEDENVSGNQTAMFKGNDHEIKIVGGKNDSVKSNDSKKKEYVSPSQIAPISDEAKNNILAYMNDDELFGKSEKSGSKGFGLEGQTEVKSGFGLEGDEHVSDPQITSYGPKINSYEGTPDKEVHKKMSKAEAQSAMLTSEELNTNKVLKKFKKPPISLLDKNPGSDKASNSILQQNAIKLEDTLKSFNVDAKVVQVTQGPTVTRYEIQPAVGVRVSKILSLENDIALNLQAKSIRIEAPIPGKSAVGVEIQNEKNSMVVLRELIDSDDFKNHKSNLAFAVGKDIAGNNIIGDLASMPHLLIAGSTGSGKSVCINSIITSLIYKTNPDKVKLILIDPKVVELSNYDGIPHLMIPVVTDPQKSTAALNWACAEMDDRYNKFAVVGVRDLESYNEYVIAEGEEDKVLPQVVIIIDELADLMMSAPSQIEQSIARLAQKARAAGMHLIVATQRPSVDVITGVIKANIPSRIAFAVSSNTDSRVILDMPGAEKLVGKGDMLYYPMGTSKPYRVQGTFVSDHEVNKVIDYVKEQVGSEGVKYSDDVLARIERVDTQSQEKKEMSDELLPDAIDLVVRSGQASVSMLQRRFRIGYNRAANIIDTMEERGIVGPQDGSRPRQVLMTENELIEMETIPNEEEES